MKHIGMILDAPFPPDPRVENEAITLINHGYAVYLFCLSYDASPKQEAYKGIHIRRYASNRLVYKLSALAYTFPFYRWALQGKIQHFLQENAIDYLHIHDLRIAETAYKANQKRGLPNVLDLHDNTPEVMKLYPHLQKFPGKYLISPQKWKQKESVFLQKATKVVTVSPEFVKDIAEREQLATDKIVLVPNTVRQSFYTDYQRDTSIIERFSDRYVLLYLGDTHVRRGLSTAIRSLRKLRTSIPNILLVIVGKSTTDPILKQAVAEEGVTDQVSFEGWQNVALFPSYILSSSICISPLRKNKQHDLAYANKIFQYMSFAKPILVSNCNAQQSIVESKKTGLVHEEQNPEDFSQKVLELYQHPTKAAQLGANGKRYIEEEFCWEKVSTNLVSIYDSFGHD